MSAKPPAAKPFLKWAGGKRQLLGELLGAVERLGQFDAYHEPFVGGGALSEDPVAVWQALDVQAVKTGRVYHLTSKLYVHPSQFAVDTAREFARRLHPKALE